jgi:hypothetical protein
VVLDQENFNNEGTARAATAMEQPVSKKEKKDKRKGKDHD